MDSWLLYNPFEFDFESYDFHFFTVQRLAQLSRVLPVGLA
jgi:hypothetical protein